MQNQVQILNLKKLSNSELFESAKSSVQSETNATLRVLYILREIETRRAFAEKSYPSLFEFCVDYLGYKKGAAYRRIAAMRALKDLPELEEKIQEGKLDLTTVAQAQTYFAQRRRENLPLAKTEKIGLLVSLESKSTRETEKFFAQLSPAPHPKEKLKELDENNFELKLLLPKRVQEKLAKLKTLMGPKKSGTETIEAIEKALDLAIQTYEVQFEKAFGKSDVKSGVTARSKTSAPVKTKVSALGKCQPPTFQTRFLPLNLKRQIWQRDQGQCSFKNPQTKIRCNSKYKLEIDHIEAKAFGGKDEIENLRLLCRAHNQWTALRQFGKNKMRPYLNPNLS